MGDWTCPDCGGVYDQSDVATHDEKCRPPTVDQLRARLAEVEAERDAAVAQAADMQTMANEQEQRAIRAEAEVERLRAALTTLRGWDMLDACADGPWARRIIDAALSTDAQGAAPKRDPVE